MQNFRLFTAHVKFHQICTWIGSFCWKCIKFLMTMKSDAKFEEKLISCLTRAWWILTEHLKVSKICTLIGSFCEKYATFDLKKYRGVVLHDTKEQCKIWRKTELWFEKNIRNLKNFHQSTWKCQNWDFDGILLSKVDNAWAANLQRSYV